MIDLGRVGIATSRRAVPCRRGLRRACRSRSRTGRTSRSARMDACWRRMTATGSSILDATTHAVVRTLSATQPDGSFDAAWSPDGTRLAVTGTGTAMVELYDTATWQPIGPDGGAAAGPVGRSCGDVRRDRPDDPLETGRRLNIARAVAFSPDSTELVAGTDDGAVWTWDARTGAPAGSPLQLGGPVLDVAFNPVSRRSPSRYADTSAGGRRGVRTRARRRRSTRSSVDDALGRSPGGRRLQPGRRGAGDRWGEGRRPLLGRDHRVGDRHSGSSPSAGWVLDLAWTPSGTTLVSSGTDGTVRLIDVATQHRRRTSCPASTTTGSMRRCRRTASVCTPRTRTARASTGRSIPRSGRSGHARMPVAR